MGKSIPWLHRFGRRSFLQVSGAGIAGLAISGGCEGVTEAVVDLPNPLIVGSGFGGSVSALRLAEAGIGATVLERGRRWEISPEGDTFASMRDQDERCAWLSNQTHVGISTRVRRYVGLIDKFKGDNIDAIMGAAVGGGSLVYAGMMVQPPRELFEAAFPAAVDYQEMLTRWYPRVGEVLTLARVPDDVLASETYLSARIFLEQAERAGLTTELNLSAIDWDLVRAEIRGEFPAEAIAGDYIYGLNSGAKGQVDRTYLARAEATGLVDVRPLHQVTSIAADPAGGYRVRCERIDEVGEVEERLVFRVPALFLSAGSIHTTRLLVEARARGDLPLLSSDVGEGWGHNGQHILMRNGLGVSVGLFQGGPPCAIIRDLSNPIAPVTVEYGAAAFGYDCSCLICPASSLNDGFGSLTWNPTEQRTELKWALENGATAILAGEDVAGRLNAANGGSIAALPGRSGKQTFHSLGGVVMGRAADTFGRVNGYAGLYAIDGSMVPGATPTANPAWTISALAERALDTIVREDFS